MSTLPPEVKKKHIYDTQTYRLSHPFKAGMATAVHYTVHVNLQYRCPPAEFNQKLYSQWGGGSCGLYDEMHRSWM